VGRLTLITGGARSGKSRHAERLAAEAGGSITYVATMEAGDEDLARRIARHRERRPQAWTTVEAPLGVPDRLACLDPEATVLADCLSLWVSNELHRRVPGGGASPADWEAAIDAIVAETERIAEVQARRRGALIVVTNEVGWGIVPMGALSRAYRDALGLANQALAEAADTVVLVASGLPLVLKGAP
jgi:adenosylcobinamide kinase/adenosylcobinamide-phosphate guanylyltransferase